MKIDFGQTQTQIARDKAATVMVRDQRLAAYRAESDNLRMEIQYDADIAGVTPDFTRWHTAVRSIKERYPLPKNKSKK